MASASYIFISQYIDPTIVPNNSYPITEPVGTLDGMTFGIGGGVLYRLTDELGLRGSLNYNAVVLPYSDANSFNLVPNHLSLSVGIRFSVEKDAD